MKNRTALDRFETWILVLLLGAGLAGCANPSGSAGSASSLVLNKTSAELVVGGPPLRLTATQPVAWSSSNPAVVSVSSSGLVTALAMGTATITATGATTVSCTIHSNVFLMWGSVQTNNGPLPVYWKDEVLHLLPVGTGTQVYGVVDATIIDGTDVYMGGHLIDSTNTVATPVYWKNGVLIPLSAPAAYIYRPDWTQPNLDSQGNLYFRGVMWYDAESGLARVPGEWVNGTWTQLPMTLPDGRVATSGYVSSEYFEDSGHQIYFSGALVDPDSGLDVPVYWKGVTGAAKYVDDVAIPSAYGGFVSATLGPINQPVMTLLALFDSNHSPKPAYSVQGNVTAVSTGTASNAVLWWAYDDGFGNTLATGMSGPSVGFWQVQKQVPTYWKNWHPVVLPVPAGYTNGVENGSYVDSTGAYYFAGQAANSLSSIPVYWMNGVVHALPISGYLGGTANARLIGLDF